MFKIACEVYGGVTGHRKGFLRKDNKEQEFATREEAQKVLPESRTTEKGVTFNYWIVEEI